MEVDVWGIVCLLYCFFFQRKKEELIDKCLEGSQLFSANITSWQRIHKGFVHSVRKKKKRKSFKSTAHDHASFVRQIFSPLSESPWETNYVFLFTPPPRWRIDKAGSGTGRAKLMSACRGQRAGNKRGAKMKAVQVKSDMCHSVMSFIPTSRVTVAAAMAWVRGWHQRHKLSDRLWKDLIPLCHCSPG